MHFLPSSPFLAVSTLNSWPKILFTFLVRRPPAFSLCPFYRRRSTFPKEMSFFASVGASYSFPLPSGPPFFFFELRDPRDNYDPPSSGFSIGPGSATPGHVFPLFRTLRVAMSFGFASRLSRFFQLVTRSWPFLSEVLQRRCFPCLARIGYGVAS